jgi:hypothetical protein
VQRALVQYVDGMAWGVLVLLPVYIIGTGVRGHESMNKRKPAGKRRDKAHLERELISAFERATARDHPNPNRVGCPSPARLRQIAEAGATINAEVGDHIAQCWPCVQDLKQLGREKNK